MNTCPSCNRPLSMPRPASCRWCGAALEEQSREAPPRAEPPLDSRLGTLAPLVRDGELSGTWVEGLLLRVSLHASSLSELQARVTALRALPAAAQLTALDLSLVSEDDGGDWTAVLAAAPLQTLEHLSVNAPEDDELHVNDAGSVDLRTLWSRLSRLRSLQLNLTEGRLEGMHLPELGRLELGAISRSNLAALADAPLPKLEALSLWLGGPAELAQIATLLERHRGLTALGLMGGSLRDEVLGLVEKLTALRALDLSDNELRDATHLVALAPRFEWLNISFNELEEADLDRIIDAAPDTEVTTGA